MIRGVGSELLYGRLADFAIGTEHHHVLAFLHPTNAAKAFEGSYKGYPYSPRFIHADAIWRKAYCQFGQHQIARMAAVSGDANIAA